MVVVTDHDSKALARKTFRCHARDLGDSLGLGRQTGFVEGFTGVTVACEPTGHRWRVLGQLGAEREMPFVLQPEPLRHVSGNDLAAVRGVIANHRVAGVAPAWTGRPGTNAVLWGRPLRSAPFEQRCRSTLTAIRS
jgi:hypothetical protein